MTNNRFAQVKEEFAHESTKKRPGAKPKKAAQKAPEAYDKKKRFQFALHHDVRYEKLEDLVAFHRAKSVSDYLESLIIKEWEKMQRKLK